MVMGHARHPWKTQALGLYGKMIIYQILKGIYAKVWNAVFVPILWIIGRLL